MADREKVIKALGICAVGTNSCEKCPLKDKCHGVSNAAMAAAIELLKEQEWQIKNRDESIEKAQEEIKWLRGMLKEQVQEQIVHCKDCKYGLYTGTEYHCDKHSGHENRLGEDQYYKEWHNGNWFCADGERR